MSAAGDAWQMLPVSVARLRIWIDPTVAAASTSAGKCRRIRLSFSMSAITTVAPILSPRSVSPIVGASSFTCLISMTMLGLRDRLRSSTTRSVPPASRQASPPCLSSSASTSDSVAGRV